MRRTTSIFQKLPADHTKRIVQFHCFVLYKRQERCYLLLQIGNVDQTPVYFDVPHNTTIANKGSSTITVRTTGNKRLRYTVMLAVTADGNKLSPYVIFKRNKMPKGQKIPKNLPREFLSKHSQRDGWILNTGSNGSNQSVTRDQVRC